MLYHDGRASLGDIRLGIAAATADVLSKLIWDTRTRTTSTLRPFIRCCSTMGEPGLRLCQWTLSQGQVWVHTPLTFTSRTGYRLTLFVLCSWVLHSSCDLLAI